jgi:5-methylcytosine-specific restriction protein A
MSPFAPMHPCSYAGCPALVRDGSRCEKHAIQQQRELIDRRKGDPMQAQYHTQAWRALRAAKLATHPLCERCKPRVTAATQVHHKRDIRDGGELLDFNNLESLCLLCHSKHTAKSGSRWGSRKPLRG